LRIKTAQAGLPTPFNDSCVSASAQTEITIVMMVMMIGVELGDVHSDGHFSRLRGFCQKLLGTP
jgi:hypothetical protein